MRISAVVDPSAFDADYFDPLYRVHAEDFLKGIGKNGLLIVDSDNKLRDALLDRADISQKFVWFNGYMYSSGLGS